MDGLSVYGGWFIPNNNDAFGLLVPLTDIDFVEGDPGEGFDAYVFISFNLQTQRRIDPWPCPSVDCAGCPGGKKYTCTVIDNQSTVTISASGVKRAGVTVEGDLLTHENLHITIAEKHRGIIEAAVRAVTGSGSDCGLKAAASAAIADWNSKVEIAFSGGFAAYESEQHQYDLETDHSRNVVVQQQWNDKYKEKEEEEEKEKEGETPQPQ